jgi:hypothetical protein
MSTKALQHPLRASELDRLAQWLKLAPAEAEYHRFQGIRKPNCDIANLWRDHEPKCGEASHPYGRSDAR